MTKKELVKLLNEYPDEMDVEIFDIDMQRCQPIQKVVNGTGDISDDRDIISIHL